MDTISAFWCRIPSRPNFGDALTPWIIRRVTGHYPRFEWPSAKTHKFFVTGSVLGLAGSNCTVWGAGIMDRHETISPESRLTAVRGPLSRNRALACGADCPDVLGDPALLMPRWYEPRRGPRRRGGIVGHFSDAAALEAAWRPSDGLKLIDIQAPVESVIDAIVSCDFVASSSLHALIVSHAYRIPAVWIKFRDLPSGDDSKFFDHYLSIGQACPSPLRTGYDDLRYDLLAAAAAAVPLDLDLDLLWAACPFRR